jgi:phosphoglycolate phosphatase-like HAD superfamily hydrolase
LPKAAIFDLDGTLLDSVDLHALAWQESDDPDVIAAAMKKPGVVLRRPVGSDGPFGEHAELPTDLGGTGPRKTVRKSKSSKAKQPSSRPVAEQKRRDRQRAAEEAVRQKERERRRQAVDKAQASLEKAEQEHAKRAAAIQAEVGAIEKRSQTEEARWDKEKERLEAVLRRARG